jgi:hypothetical protein
MKRKTIKHASRQIVVNALMIGIFLCGLTTAYAAVIIRGPYLQSSTTSSVLIRWRTDVPTNSMVKYGRNLRVRREVTDIHLTTEHEVKIEDLRAGQRYFYTVGSTTEELAGGRSCNFYTHPEESFYETIRIWVIGDSGGTNSLHSEQAEDVRDAFLHYNKREQIDAWLMLGDNAYEDGTDSEYQIAVFDRFPRLLKQVALWPNRGNHDRLYEYPEVDYLDTFTMPTSGEAGGFPSGTNAYYSFDISMVHFICLDLATDEFRRPDSEMMDWLEADLEQNTKRWTIAYWHHAPYTDGSHDSDSEHELIEIRESWLPVLEAGGVDLVLSGHSHSYERSYFLNGHYGQSGTLDESMIIDDGDGSMTGDGPYQKGRIYPEPYSEGTVYAVVGSSTKLSHGDLNHPAMFTSLYELGSMVIEADYDYLNAVFINDVGDVLDDFSIWKWTIYLD